MQNLNLSRNKISTSIFTETLNYYYYKNNDLVKGDSAFCHPEETLLTEAQAEAREGNTAMRQ